MNGNYEKNNRCPVCGGCLEPGRSTVPFLLKNITVLVNDVPAEICSSCHEPFMSGKVTDQVNNLLQHVRDSKAQVFITSYPKTQSEKTIYIDQEDIEDKQNIPLAQKIAETREAYSRGEGRDVNSLTTISIPRSADGYTWPPNQGNWTLDDWLKLPEDGYRYEVISGELYMSPPPRIEHQRASLRLVTKLNSFVVEHNLGEVFAAPIGVQLPNQEVPLQPDIIFIQAARQEIIGEETVEGAPDLIIEILSPGNWLYDRRTKMRVYQEGGVREYWIVEPRTQTIEVYILEEGTFLLTGQYQAGEKAVSQVVAGFEIPVADVFSS